MTKKVFFFSHMFYLVLFVYFQDLYGNVGSIMFWVIFMHKYIYNSKGFTSYKHTHSHTHTHTHTHTYIYIWNMINIIESLSLYAHSGTSNEMGLAALYAKATDKKMYNNN